MLALLHVVMEASRTSEFPRLNARAARQVIGALAEWLESDDRESAVPGESRRAVARELRDNLFHGVAR